MLCRTTAQFPFYPLDVSRIVRLMDAVPHKCIAAHYVKYPDDVKVNQARAGKEC